MFGARRKTTGTHPNFNSSYLWCWNNWFNVSFCFAAFSTPFANTEHLLFLKHIFLKTSITTNLNVSASNNFYGELLHIDTFTEIKLTGQFGGGEGSPHSNA